MHLTRVLPALLVPTALPSPAPAALAAPERDRTGVEVVAHRGASDDAPENTLAAVDAAVAQRADTIEVDIRRTADGHLVLLHDATLGRTTDVEQVYPTRALDPVGAFTLAELRRLDAGSWFGPEFAGERIPTVAELRERTADRAGLLLELKDPARYEGIELEVAAEIGDALRVAVQSFDHASMTRFAEAAPGLPAGWLFGIRPAHAELDTAAEVADQVNPSFRAVDAELVAAVRERGMSSGAYTVNEGADLRRVLAAGVDRIITDRPAVARGVLVG